MSNRDFFPLRIGLPARNVISISGTSDCLSTVAARLTVFRIGAAESRPLPKNAAHSHDPSVSLAS